MTDTVTVTGMAHGGRGVARVEGQVCFVSYALPGDVMRINVERRSKGVLWASIDELVEPSPHRVDAPCPVFGACGGCTWLHFAYPAQAEAKRQIVKDCFARIARADVDVDWREDANLRLGYRTRAEFTCDAGAKGFYAEGTHKIVDIEACPLCHPKLNAALKQLRELSYKGRIEITVNPDGDEVLVWTKHPHRKLKSVFPLASTPEDEAKRPFFVFDGAPIVAGAFSQSSLLLNRLLVRTVKDLAGKPSRVLDLYCGNGNLSLGFENAERVLGLDHTREAVRGARAMGAGEYRRGAENAFTAALREEHWDVVILDPPRAGAKPIAGPLAQAAAQRIVYVSCDPATQARDVKTLTEAGWDIERVVALDLFPNTCHVESVCLLTRETQA